ncbi:hypothetical protein, partial [Escherichia coli]|uniref:hypothetical protein n=1 Tax=Escherichia coli TaxID=562 RepID=UPI001BDBC714
MSQQVGSWFPCRSPCRYAAEAVSFLGVDDTSLQATPTQIRADASQQSSWLGDACHQPRIIS